MKIVDAVARTVTVKLRAQLARSQRGDINALEDAFVLAAPAWIEAEGLSDAVLNLAFGRRKSKAKPKKGPRQKRVRRSDVESCIPPKNQTFSAHDLAKSSGASYATARSVIL